MKFFVVSDYKDNKENRMILYVLGGKYDKDCITVLDICNKVFVTPETLLKMQTYKQFEKSVLSSFVNDYYCIVLGKTKEEVIQTLQNPATYLDVIAIMPYDFKRNMHQVEIDITQKEFDLWLLKLRLSSQNFSNKIKDLVSLDKLQNMYKQDLQTRCKDLLETSYYLKLQSYTPVLAKSKKLLHLYQYKVDEYIFFVVYIGNNLFFNLGMTVNHFDRYLYEGKHSIIKLTSKDILYDTGLSGEFVKEICQN